MPPPFTPTSPVGAFPIVFPAGIGFAYRVEGPPSQLAGSVSNTCQRTLYDAYGSSFSCGLRVCLAARADYESSCIAGKPTTGFPFGRLGHCASSSLGSQATCRIWVTARGESFHSPSVLIVSGHTLDQRKCRPQTADSFGCAQDTLR